MSVTLAPAPKFQGLGFGGLPTPGGKLFTFIAGTNTPQATYTDSTQTQQNLNPIVLDANGQCDLWLVSGQTYKLRLTDFFGNQIYVVDQLQGFLTTTALYPQTPAEASIPVAPKNFIYPPGNVLRYGADPVGLSDSSVAFQQAIDICRFGGARYISIPQGRYLINTTLDLTLLGDTLIEGLGARQGVQIMGGTTGSWVMDCTGMFRSKLANFTVQNAPTTTAIGGILLARTNSQPALYNCFDGIYMQQYNLLAPAAKRAIGWAIIGAEENTFHDCKNFSNSPYVISTTYADISANYPSPYQNANIPLGNSCGMNTWSGENNAVTLDGLFPAITLNGCNTVDFGNMYCANVNIGTPGTNYKCISVTGGTLEVVRGQFKIEVLQTIVSVDSVSAQLMGWDIHLSLGAGITNTNGVWEINPGASSVFSGIIDNFKLGVFYESPGGTIGKPLIVYGGIVDAGVTTQSLSNIEIETNQTLAQAGGVPAMISIFCTVVNRYELRYVDVSYSIGAHKTIKRFSSAFNLGLAATSPGGTGAAISTITFPPIIAGGESRNTQVRVRGLLSSVIESGGGGFGNVTMCPFDTMVSSLSINTGSISVSSGVSDLVFTPANSLLSNSVAAYQLTAVNVTQAVTGRVLTITAKPVGTGTSIASIVSYAVDMEIEMITSGRIGDLIYLT
jgi:hypothetical protein